jgi:hypothetical protein
MTTWKKLLLGTPLLQLAEVVHVPLAAEVHIVVWAPQGILIARHAAAIAQRRIHGERFPAGTKTQRLIDP